MCQMIKMCFLFGLEKISGSGKSAYMDHLRTMIQNITKKKNNIYISQIYIWNLRHRLITILRCYYCLNFFISNFLSLLDLHGTSLKKESTNIEPTR